MVNPIRARFSEPAQGGGGFNAYAAGNKHYGAGRPMPTTGKIANKYGYAERDAKAAARRSALMKRIGS
jgi:hypothetical protein